MSKKPAVFRPRYQLYLRGCSCNSLLYAFSFEYNNTTFVIKAPLLWATETHKIVLHWASSHSTPPVVYVEHGSPTGPDGAQVRDNCPYRQYKPYAMATAKFQCLGEKEIRSVRVYFCDIELHEGLRNEYSKGGIVVSESGSVQ